MVGALENDYANTKAMIFGAAPAFEEILASIKQIERIVNKADYQRLDPPAAPRGALLGRR